ncbi:ABC transporter ATP-binding protein [Pseudobdellovibrio exovorus]|uniref:ABC-type phosphonate transport protein, ATP-binding protein n=1 Tax=Pseudobdellovibrio exovorus JSS TaxID=1184267 RepID=M4V968_9BACT|nr:ABC transporter ATP-binding protein [Pseudobdellovibrio exovorus]AGH94970.1 ABC-type phosphonate transport protein, ATP-binding protein [Pseudobdellovibrio exovorus JSS]
MTILEVRKLNKKFRTDFYKRPTQALKDVSFSIERGRFVGFIGPNGAGKSTTIKCLLELIFADSGEVLFFGEKFNLRHKAKIGFLPERPFFQEFLTGQEFLKLHWDLAQMPRKDFPKRVEEVLQLVKLAHAKDKKLKEYSKGMLQRIGIAQALICAPEFLILDEPMSGLDPDGRILIKQILRALKEQKTTVLMSTHLLEDVEEFCDDLLVIHSGVLEYSGEVKGLQKNYESLEEAYRHFKIALTENLNA